MALLRRAFQFLFVPQLLTDLGSPKLTSPQALRKAFGDRTPICSSRGSRCLVTTATVYRNPSWDELETSPWDERSPCNKHYVIGKASLLGGSGESPRCCSLPDRDEPASSGLRSEGASRPAPAVLAPLLGHQAQLPPAFLSPQDKLFPAWLPALSLGQAALGHTAGMFLHCRAPPPSQVFGYGKVRPCLVPSRAVGRTALSKPAGKDGRSMAVSLQGQPSSPAAPACPGPGHVGSYKQLLEAPEHPWPGCQLCPSQQPRDAAESTAAIRGDTSPQCLVTFLPLLFLTAKSAWPSL